jgi:pimeloyl-ACP methyl ester carboxylesterase
MRTLRDDNILKLPDGRQLCYAEYGDPKGVPVMLIHGVPGYRLYWKYFPEFPFLPGVRFIAPDRPGYGMSDFKPGITFTDWPDDVIALANSLKIDRFSMVSVSGGGPYTLACAWKIPERLNKVVVISTMGPLVPDVMEAISRTNRTVYQITKYAPWLMRLNMKMLSYMQNKNADKYLRRMSYKLSGSDKTAIMKKPVRDVLMSMMSEATQNGSDGYAQDVINVSMPWPFDLTEIKKEVHVWQPEDDTSTPPVIARYLKSVIPKCHTHYVPNAGHLWHIEHLCTVLRELINVPGR